MVPHPRSKKQRFAFQTFTETPAATPSILELGITHQPHGSGDGAKCGAKFAATPHVIYVEVTGVCSEREEHPQKVYVSKSIFLVFLPPKAARTQIDE